MGLSPPIKFPSGPKKKLAKGLFVERGKAHKTPKKVAAAKAEAYSGQPRKNGQ